MRALVITAALATLAAGCCRNAAAPDPAAAAIPQRHVVPNEYVFTVAPGTSPAAIQGSLADLAPRRIQPLGNDRILVVFGEDPGLSRLGFRIGDGRILDVQPNYTYETKR